MTSKNQKLQNLRITEMSQRHPLPDNVLLKHISMTMNMCTTVGELLEVAFLVGP
jgi:hypothetical protein